jgi:hypothetical protein
MSLPAALLTELKTDNKVLVPQGWGFCSGPVVASPGRQVTQKDPAGCRLVCGEGKADARHVKWRGRVHDSPVVC